MNIQEIITKKKEGNSLSKLEIDYFIKKFMKNEITDYQASALIMAICINGMTNEEILDLTMAMIDSGEKLDLSALGENVVDKHSTGGVGDKITIILMPIIASLGIPVAKISGRGLGYTGGTVDKLEAIPGYNTNISIDEFINNVRKIGISLIGQTKNLVPADKRIYAIRDSIACTDSIPLIASSIMSKKIASGANKIVLDITVGSGAFMKNKKDAIELAKCMKNIGEIANKETVCVLTNMNQPLGNTVGNILEIEEAIQCLKGNMPEDIKNIVEIMGAYIIKLSGKGDKIEENTLKIRETIKNGNAYNKFLELIKNQGGDISYIEDISKFEKAKFIKAIYARNNGYIEKINAEEIGKISVLLGAGRIKKEDKIDYQAGIVFNKKIGDAVKERETIAYIHTNNDSIIEEAVEKFECAFNISKENVSKENTIIDIIE